jgi:predicted DsbA family dithiol-disulfide isomerase
VLWHSAVALQANRFSTIMQLWRGCAAASSITKETSMTTQIDVWSDFVCPFCFLIGASLARLQQEHDVAITWHAFELRPRGSPPMPPEYRARIEAGQPRLMAMAREQYGLEINAGPFGIDSRPALIGEQYAVAQGRGGTYHDAVANAYWLRAQSIDNREILADIADSVGLGRAAFLAALDAPEYNAAVDAEIAWARANEISGVPALVFDEKYLVVGAQPYPVLEQVLRQCEAEAASAGSEH